MLSIQQRASDLGFPIQGFRSIMLGLRDYVLALGPIKMRFCGLIPHAHVKVGRESI